MKIQTRRRVHDDLRPGATGVARVDGGKKRLTKRIRAGDIAIIDQSIDRGTAQALLRRRPAAVLATGPCVSPHYPSQGSELLLSSGVPVIDNLGRQLLDILRDGDLVRLTDAGVYLGAHLVATGGQQSVESVTVARESASRVFAAEVEAATGSAMEYLSCEHELLIDGIGVPEIEASLEGKHVVIVTRGPRYRDDLHALRRYFRKFRPILIGVDEGADALLDADLVPHLAVGDLDRFSDAVLMSGAEVVARAYRGRAPSGMDRARRLGLEPVVFPIMGSSEDAALLLAEYRNANVIVTAGSHANLVEFLEKGRSGMATSFLTRLQAGSKVVDAQTAGQLCRRRFSPRALLTLALLALATLGIVIWVAGMR